MYLKRSMYGKQLTFCYHLPNHYLLSNPKTSRYCIPTWLVSLDAKYINQNVYCRCLLIVWSSLINLVPNESNKPTSIPTAVLQWPLIQQQTFRPPIDGCTKRNPGGLEQQNMLGCQQVTVKYLVYNKVKK